MYYTDLPAPLLPANYTARTKLLQDISIAVVTTTITPTKQVTVAIRGIGGIGKSTLAKAVCHEKLIQDHFPDGFIWISLTPSHHNDPTDELRHIYNKLTNKAVTGNMLYMKDLIESLLTKHSYRLLIILDDVWNAEDAMPYIEMFSNCKIILTTRKQNINLVIHPKHSFDVEPMEINEATALLTLHIQKMQALHPKDINKLGELAEDLHCWPLLLNLVHGQLYFHCTELNESPRDAIFSVQSKLSKNGLTAFDIDKKSSRDFAVKVSLDTTLELLTKQEVNILQYIVCTLGGFGRYAIKDAVFANSKMQAEQFEKCIENLYFHGLVKFDSVIFHPSNCAISCIGMHEIIAQYVTETISLEKSLSTFEDVNRSFGVLFNLLTSSFGRTDNLACTLLCVISNMTALLIRSMLISAKQIQVCFSSILNEAVQQNPLLLQTDTVKEFFNQPPVEKLYITITRDCSYIQSLIADERYDEAKAWFKEYNRNHPIHKIVSPFVTVITDSIFDVNEHAILDDPAMLNYASELSFNIDYRCEYAFDLYMYTKLLLKTGASEDDILGFVLVFNLAQCFL